MELRKDVFYIKPKLQRIVYIALTLPKYKKFEPYWRSFHNLTDDEQNRVLAKHKGYRRYHQLTSLQMRFAMKQLHLVLQVGFNSGKSHKLIIEPLDEAITVKTYDFKNIRI